MFVIHWFAVALAYEKTGPIVVVTGITEPAMKRDSETPCRDGACFAPGPGLYILHLLS